MKRQQQVNRSQRESGRQSSVPRCVLQCLAIVVFAAPLGVEAQYWGGMQWCDGLLAVATRDAVVVADPGRAQVVSVSVPPSDGSDRRREVSFSPDCGVIAVVDSDAVRLVRWREGAVQGLALPADTPRVVVHSASRGQRSVLFSPSGTKLVLVATAQPPLERFAFLQYSLEGAMRRLPLTPGLHDAPSTFAFIDEQTLAVLAGGWGSLGQLYRVDERRARRVGTREFSRILFAGRPLRAVAQRFRNDAMSLVEVDLHSGVERTFARGYWLRTFTADARRVLVNVRRGESVSLRSVALDGGPRRRYALDPDGVNAPPWGADAAGSRLVGRLPGHGPIAVVDADHAPRTLTALPQGTAHHVEEHLMTSDGHVGAFLLTANGRAPCPDGVRTTRTLRFVELATDVVMRDVELGHQDHCEPIVDLP